MRAIQKFRIKFAEGTFEYFQLAKNEEAIYDVLEYTVRHAAVNFENTAKVESVTFLESNLMQVVIDLPQSKNYEITDTLTAIANTCCSLPYCANVALTDDNPEL